MLARSVVRLIDDAKALQTLQVEALAGETRDRVERFQQYGFTAHPLAGAEAILLSLGGNRDHAVAIAVDDRRHRKNGLAPGEVALYTDEGDFIHFKRGRLIDVVAGTKVKVTAPDVEVVASTKVAITSPLTDVTGNLTVSGLITGAGGLAISGGSGAQISGDVTVSGGDVSADGIGLKTHVHGGVQTGAGTTGPAQ